MTTTIGNLDAFLEWARYLTEQNKHDPKYIVAFRGQWRDYGAIIPSEYRPGARLATADLEEKFRDIFEQIYNVGRNLEKVIQEDYDSGMPFGGVSMSPQWDPLTSEAFREAYSDYEDEQSAFDEVPYAGNTDYARDELAKIWYDNDLTVEPMLQHYGVPTSCLDLTSEPLVALFFAIQRTAIGKNGKVHYYPNTNNGIVYAFKVQADKLVSLHGHLHEGMIPGIGGERGTRQAGYLFYGATKEEPDLSGYVVSKAFIEPSIINASDERLAHVNQKYLLPSPNEDRLYAAFLKLRNETIDPTLAEILANITIYDY